MSFFFTVTVEYCGLPKSAIVEFFLRFVKKIGRLAVAQCCHLDVFYTS